MWSASTRCIPASALQMKWDTRKRSAASSSAFSKSKAFWGHGGNAISSSSHPIHHNIFLRFKSTDLNIRFQFPFLGKKRFKTGWVILNTIASSVSCPCAAPLCFFFARVLDQPVKYWVKTSDFAHTFNNDATKKKINFTWQWRCRKVAKINISYGQTLWRNCA